MPGLLSFVDLESIIIFFCEFDRYRLPISIDINHQLYWLISDIDFYRLTTPGGLPGRLHISINTKYQSIKNTYCSFRFLCHPACLEAPVSTVHPVVTAKLSLFPPAFGSIWYILISNSLRPYLSDNSLRPRNETRWFFFACTVFRSSLTNRNTASVSLECHVRIDDAVKGYINFYNAGISSHAVEFGIIGSCNRYDLDMHGSCGQLLTKYGTGVLLLLKI